MKIKVWHVLIAGCGLFVAAAVLALNPQWWPEPEYVNNWANWRHLILLAAFLVWLQLGNIASKLDDITRALGKLGKK